MATTISATMDERAAGDFEAFYAEWFDRVYNYARHRTGSATRADEIASDVFTRALAGWSRLDPNKGDARSWLFSIAFRAIADHYRAEKRRRWFSLGLLFGSKEERDQQAPEPKQEPEVERLMAALGELSDQHREVVSLKFFSGMTNRAIAKLTGLTESNVGIILFRSIRRMRKGLPAGGEADHG
ncbi:MAG: sigma-70 family RNA polymerase sigma factor [Elusimicrobia bacterium]|nr:sigma-70 family RNA polymerase sigma factor [Elusimicrobiota bacterium]